MTTLSPRRTHRTVVERIRRGDTAPAALSDAVLASVLFFMSAILNYTALKGVEVRTGLAGSVLRVRWSAIGE